MHKGQIPPIGTGRAWLQPPLTVGPGVLFPPFVWKQHLSYPWFRGLSCLSQ